MILYVGNTDTSLSDYAIRHNPLSKLIEAADLPHLDDISVGHVSIGDHSIVNFITIIDHASEIYYVPSDCWEVGIQKQTEMYLRMYSHKIPVHNLDKITNDNMLYLADGRKTEDSQLWVAGCSFTFGTGVDKNQTYGARLSQSLNLPLSVLAEEGSSLSWAADQILRSDIRKNDIVVWGLTGIGRFPYYQNGAVIHVTNTSYANFRKFNQIINEKIFVSDHLLYKACTAISQVIAHSQHIGYKLVLTQFPLSEGSHELFMLHFLSQYDFFVHNYVNADDKFIDYISDNVHPGPLQHQYYANLLLEYINQYYLS